MKNDEKNQSTAAKKPYRKTYILAAGIILLLIIAALVFIWFTQEDPRPDPASEKIIREAAAKILNKDPYELFDEDYARITNFNFGRQTTTVFSSPSEKWPIAFNHNELSDIKLLEKFTNLCILDLGRIDIPESTVPKWKKILSKSGILSFENKFTIDLNPLKELIYLQELQLGGAAIKNIKTLTRLINLRSIKLFETPVSNLEPIKGLTNLETIYLFSTQVSDLKPIMNLTNLKALHLLGNQVSNLEPIRGLISLEYLSLSGHYISDLRPINELVNLQELLISSTSVIDLETIKNLANLRELYLNGMQVTDLNPIKNLTKLQRLDIFYCKKITNEQIEDLQKALPKLKIYR
jgi:hypothetical protein